MSFCFILAVIFPALGVSSIADTSGMTRNISAENNKTIIPKSEKTQRFDSSTSAARAVKSAKHKRVLPDASASTVEQFKTVYTRMPSTALYKERDSSSASILVPYMTALVLLETYPASSTGAWSKLLYSGKEYYLWQANDAEAKLTSTRSSFSWTGSNKYQNEVIALAREILTWQTGYAHRQSNGIPDTDGVCYFDCSGLASYMMDTVMSKHVPTYDLSADIVKLHNTDSIYNEGFTGEYTATTLFTCSTDDSRMEISSTNMNKLRAGDILFFDLPDETDADTERNVGYTHCGVYLGNGEFIHATRSWGGTQNHPGYGAVCIMPLYGFYAQNCVGARRYLPKPSEVTPADKAMYTTGINNRVFSTKVFEAGTEIINLEADTCVTLLWTDNGNWAYISYTANGKTGEGFIQISSLSENAPQAENKTMYVMKISQKFYEERNSESASITLYYGDEVTYIGRYSTGNWHRVSIDGKEYFVWAENGIDTVLSDDYNALMDPAGKPVKTVSKNVNMRSTADSTGSDNIVRLLRAGETVTVLAVSDNGNWSYVLTQDGERGFVASSYLSDSDDTTNAVSLFALDFYIRVKNSSAVINCR